MDYKDCHKKTALVIIIHYHLLLFIAPLPLGNMANDIVQEHKVTISSYLGNYRAQWEKSGKCYCIDIHFKHIIIEKNKNKISFLIKAINNLW